MKNFSEEKECTQNIFNKIDYDNKIINALSNVYELIVCVDLYTDTFEKIKSVDVYSEKISELKSAEKYISELSELMYLPNNTAAREFCNISTWIKRLELKDNCSFDVMSIANGWVRTNLIVVERDADGNAQKVILAVQNINDEKEKDYRNFTILNGLSVEYSTLWLIDVSNRKIRLERSNWNATIDVLSNENRSSWMEYDFAMNKYIDSYVVEEERERISKLTQFDELLRSIPETNIYTINFLKNMNGTQRYNQMVFVRTNDSFEKEYIILAYRDIDSIIREEQKREQLLKISLEAAEKANKTKSDFLANMSHEIRTPMNAILGMTEMALRENLSSNAREYIHQIQSSGKNLLVIINDILDFSKIESGKMDIIEVNYELYSLINDVSSIVNSRVEGKDIEFILDIPQNMPARLFGDNVRIQQMLVNLLNNAVKFTKRGKVTLKLEFDYINADNVVMKGIVSDTGIGIKKEDLGKLFKSFQQVDSKRNRNIEGTGLGLAITRQLLTLMKGDISVKSEYGQGSTFTMKFPQRVTGKPFEIRNPEEKINVALIISSPYVKEQIVCDLEKINSEVIDLNISGSLDDVKSGYVITEEDCFNERLQTYADEHQEIQFIVIEKYNSTAIFKMANVTTLRKPVCSLMLYSALGICDEFSRNDDTHEEVFMFTAPDAHILIVDDNAINLTVAKGLLEPLNMHIDVADGAASTIEKVKERIYDIVFMDHMMPEVDGVETTHIIRRLIPSYADVPIIALTANAAGGTKEMFLNEGMNDFVAKPIELKEIVAKIQKWLPKEKIVISDEKIIPESADSKKINIEGLDTDSAIKLLGTENLFWTVLREYYSSIDKKAEIVHKYLNEGNIRNYTVEVHSLKSTSRQIGANALADMAFSLEKAGKAEDIEYINANNENMLREFLKYKEILKEYFPDEDEITDKKHATDSEIAKKLQEIMAALEDMDVLRIDEVVGSLSEYEFDKEYSEYTEELKSAAENFDIDTCSAIAKKWLDQLNS